MRKETVDLFDYQSGPAADAAMPLAERMRPRQLDEFIGQDPVVGQGTLIRNAVENDRIFSMLLWGPPGCGKTTLARIIAGETRSYFIEFSAVLSGVKEIRSVIDEARKQMRHHRRRTILFVDEIHRFNKAQQDAFLQHVESGLITLIGATTENPSFEVIPALMSRCRVVSLNSLAPDLMAIILKRALDDPKRGLGCLGLTLSPEAEAHLIGMADGDVRSALNGLEITASIVLSEKKGNSENARCIDLDTVEKALQRKALRYDKSGEEHYNLISAFHKSLRGSDPDAAVYWMGRMVEAGEDPFYIARRMVRFASEDIGNADPYALQVALGAMDAFKFLGHPEGDLPLAQAAIYLATAPKSNAVYKAYGKVRSVIQETGALAVPFHIRNAPTRLMKDLGYGKGYRYAHDYKDGFVPQDHLPESLAGQLFYFPTERGYEKTIKQRLVRWRSLKKRSNPRPD